MNDKILDFKRASCKNCYKCLRECEVKAIKFIDGQAKIMEETCILCGACISICPQNAKKVYSQLPKFKDYIAKNEPLVISIAPSFSTHFDFRDIEDVFIDTNVLSIEETSIGAYFASNRISGILEETNINCMITNACHSVVRLIENEYPHLIKHLANVPSPMILHARLIKKKYNNKVKVVFIGPCLSKIEEARRTNSPMFEDTKDVDCVLTFEELAILMEEKSIKRNIKSDIIDNDRCLETRFYPEPGGMIKSTKINSKYEGFSIDGISNVKEFLDSIDTSEKMVVECLACKGGCLNGPFIPFEGKNLMKYRKYCKESFSYDFIYEYSSLIDEELFKVEYQWRKKEEIIPGEDEIKKVLAKVGKYNKDQELNCGACGYNSCREKAIAVINKKAELEMCLPYMKEQAKSIADKILSASPNAIIALDYNFQIVEINDSAKRLFHIGKEYLNTSKLINYLNIKDIIECIEKKESKLNIAMYFEKFDSWVEQSIVLVQDYELVLVFMKNITKERKQEEKMSSVTLKTIQTADSVIEKQMRVVQEIASLLGETTAESKLALMDLKASLIEKQRG